jgi:hypothetical protein
MTNDGVTTARQRIDDVERAVGAEIAVVTIRLRMPRHRHSMARPSGTGLGSAWRRSALGTGTDYRLPTIDYRLSKIRYSP